MIKRLKSLLKIGTFFVLALGLQNLSGANPLAGVARGDVVYLNFDTVFGGLPFDGNWLAAYNNPMMCISDWSTFAPLPLAHASLPLSKIRFEFFWGNFFLGESEEDEEGWGATDRPRGVRRPFGPLNFRTLYHHKVREEGSEYIRAKAKNDPAGLEAYSRTCQSMLVRMPAQADKLLVEIRHNHKEALNDGFLHRDFQRAYIKFLGKNTHSWENAMAYAERLFAGVVGQLNAAIAKEIDIRRELFLPCVRTVERSIVPLTAYSGMPIDVLVSTVLSSTPSGFPTVIFQDDQSWDGLLTSADLEIANRLSVELKYAALHNVCLHIYAAWIYAQFDDGATPTVSPATPRRTPPPLDLSSPRGSTPGTPMKPYDGPWQMSGGDPLTPGDETPGRPPVRRRSSRFFRLGDTGTPGRHESATFLPYAITDTPPATPAAMPPKQHSLSPTHRSSSPPVPPTFVAQPLESVPAARAGLPDELIEYVPETDRDEEFWSKIGGFLYGWTSVPTDGPERIAVIDIWFAARGAFDRGFSSTLVGLNEPAKIDRLTRELRRLLGVPGNSATTIQAWADRQYAIRQIKIELARLQPGVGRQDLGATVAAPSSAALRVGAGASAEEISASRQALAAQRRQAEVEAAGRREAERLAIESSPEFVQADAAIKLAGARKANFGEIESLVGHVDAQIGAINGYPTKSDADTEKQRKYRAVLARLQGVADKAADLESASSGLMSAARSLKAARGDGLPTGIQASALSALVAPYAAALEAEKAVLAQARTELAAIDPDLFGRESSHRPSHRSRSVELAVAAAQAPAVPSLPSSPRRRPVPPITIPAASSAPVSRPPIGPLFGSAHPADRPAAPDRPSSSAPRHRGRKPATRTPPRSGIGGGGTFAAGHPSAVTS